jgi:hypothetical protein
LSGTFQSSSLRDEDCHGGEAVRLAQGLCYRTKYEIPEFLDTLSCALAEVGQFDEAIGKSQDALTLARALGKTELCSQIDAHLGLFKKHVAFRAGLAVGSPNGSPASSPSRGK